MIDISQIEYINRRIDSNESFAVVRLPGGKHLVTEEDSSFKFSVSPWLNKEFKNIIPSSTPKTEYFRNVETIISRIKARSEAKTVYSRIISEKSVNVNWGAVAINLWTEFPDTFGFLFYDPNFGYWLGASPELLLYINSENGFKTQALAGTLPIDKDWDSKNIDEHKFVERHISEILNRYQAKISDQVYTEQKYGNIKHLSTTFEGSFPHKINREEFLNELSPTPALAGYPLDSALKDIHDFEKHERQCFGGYITARFGEEAISYVTLRCVKFDPVSGTWAAFVGSGITALSEPSVEWDETEAKANKLIQIIKSNSI